MHTWTSPTQSERVLPLYPGDLLRGFRKYRLFLLLVTVVVTGGFLLFSRYSMQYTASATVAVLVKDPVSFGEDYGHLYSWTTASQLNDTMEYAVSGPVMAHQLCEALALEDLPAVLSVDGTADTNLFTLYAAGKDRAAVIQVLRCILELCPHVTEPVIGPARFVVLSEPAVSAGPLLSWPTALLAGLVLSLLMGAAWLILYAILRNTVRTADDIRQELQLPCLGILPLQSNDPETHHRAIGHLAGILTNSLSDAQRVLIIAGTDYQDEIFRTAGDLAAVFSDAGQNVLLLTADQAAAAHFWSMDNLQLDQNPAGSIALMNKRLAPLRSRYDRIFIAAPPCGVSADALILAGAADAVVYLIRQDLTPLHSIQSCLSDFTQIDAPVLGCVLTGVDSGALGYGQLPRDPKQQPERRP